MKYATGKFIVGLGNPGSEYANFRHNIGRRIVLAFVDSLNVLSRNGWRRNDSLDADIAMIDDAVWASVLNAFMNESGPVVRKLMKYFKIDANHLFVIHDDADITFGKLKLSFGSRSAGHKGVESVIQSLRTKDFWRLRIGIQPKESKRRIRADELVLKPFSAQEERKLPGVTSAAISAIRAWLEK